MSKQPDYTIERMSDSDDIHFSTTKTTWTFDELDELLHQLYFFMEDVAIVQMEQLGRYDIAEKIREGKLQREI